MAHVLNLSSSDSAIFLLLRVPRSVAHDRRDLLFNNDPGDYALFIPRGLQRGLALVRRYLRRNHHCVPEQSGRGVAVIITG